MDTADDIAVQVATSLKDGVYAATSVEKLSGGTANFVFRANLVKPLEDGSQTVVVKHTEGFVALTPTFKLPVNRCEFEQSILSALDAFPPSTNNNITVQSPKLYHFSPSTNTQIQSDLPASTTLKTYLLNHTLTRDQCSRLGQSVGVWLRKFHAWGAEPEQEKVREEMRGNSAMRDLKFWLNYGPNITARIEKFPEILGSSKEVFDSVGKDVRDMLDRGEGTLTHGDFWNGNILLPQAELPAPGQPLKMYIIDWELTHITSPAFDLGQMIGDLFETRHFEGIEATEWLIEGFIDGYGPLDDDIAFRTAIQVGAHLICWGPSKGTLQQVEAAMKIGRDFVVSGWKKDKGFFDSTVLKCLFA